MSFIGGNIESLTLMDSGAENRKPMCREENLQKLPTSFFV